MDELRAADAGFVVTGLIEVVNAHRAHLSEIDGAIGDGDHGINMSKGFTMAGGRLAAARAGLAGALGVLGDTLLNDVGGSMGPLYGAFFGAMSEALGDRELLDAATFSAMLGAGLAAIVEIGSAKVGDKTLLDALAPAHAAFDAARGAGVPFAECLTRMAAAAEEGKESTRAMVARVGRASRLGERSRGVLDAGATSCALLLQSMSQSIGKALARGSADEDRGRL